MARPKQTNFAVNRMADVFKDIYDDCKTEGERRILDVIIADFILNEVIKGSEQSERAISRITGISKSGVGKILGRAQEFMRKGFNKCGINKVDDVIDGATSRSDAKSGSLDQ